MCVSMFVNMCAFMCLFTYVGTLVRAGACVWLSYVSVGYCPPYVLKCDSLSDLCSV